jgi:hypothetical protein
MSCPLNVQGYSIVIKISRKTAKHAKKELFLALLGA